MERARHKRGVDADVTQMGKVGPVAHAARGNDCAGSGELRLIAAKRAKSGPPALPPWRAT